MWSSCLNYRHVFSTCPASPRIAPPISVLALTSLLNSWWRITTFSKPSQFLPRACAGAIGRAVFTPHYWSLELLLSIFSTILEKPALKGSLNDKVRIKTWRQYFGSTTEYLNASVAEAKCFHGLLSHISQWIPFYVLTGVALSLNSK